MLSVTGRWISQFVAKDGRLYSTSNVEPKDKADKSNGKTNTTCIDWYLITTIYYTDGSIDVTKEYVGTTCGGCDDEGLVNLCQDFTDPGGIDPTDDDEQNIAEVIVDASSTFDGSIDTDGPTSGDGRPPFQWHATVTYGWNPQQGMHNPITLGDPYAMPESQSYFDPAYGNCVFTADFLFNKIA